MMLKTKSSKGRRMRALALAPAVAVALAVVNLPFVANALSSIDDATLFAGNKVNENPTVSETYSKQSASAVPDEVFTTCEELPKFKGGEAELYKWLAENIEYPADAPKGYGKTRVVLRFVVKSDGTIGDVEVLRGSPMACFDKAAIKVVKSMPTWMPGKVNGRPVNVQYTLPVNFKEQ